ncbi:MAG TPA: 1-deoxy-D-xylulose-5-phosphate reductoisomerase [Clostridia bacterium]|nr:1-deoxy-D-xylulose-5-phosphate reductoisomerase [Clostridia bacterium]
MKILTILGSTGSIGIQALEVARLRGFGIFSLTAHSNVKVIERQIREFKPKFAAMADENAAKDLAVRVADTETKVLGGIDGVCECAGYGVDTVLNSIVGMAGLAPTLKAIESGNEIALANKETLVAGGRLVVDAAKMKNVRILPVDSEHSAIFQSLQGCNEKSELKRIILTASGGPFFGWDREKLEGVTLEQALKHPNWSMGAKITIDSATMMNKGLELIEAVWLFDVKPEQVDIVVHRQSIIHSLIEYVDNSIIAQLGLPDMRIPIQYALTYPERYPSPVKQLMLEDFGTLTFEKPDYEAFPCINICREAIIKGGLYPAAANSANEEANRLFRQGEIKFIQIPQLIEKSIDFVNNQDEYTLEDVLNTDKVARKKVRELA